MGFQVGPRRSNVWDDVLALDKLIRTADFDITGKDEREFEFDLRSKIALYKKLGNIKGKFFSQLSKDASVRSVRIFGKNHRPDLTIDEDGIAIELKLLRSSLDGLKQSIGQAIFYRIRYRFVINLLVVDEKYKTVYEKACSEGEKDLEDICLELSKEMNIFTYIVPNFAPDPGMKKVLAWNDVDDSD